MLFPITWLPTSAAFALLTLGAAALAGLMFLAARKAPLNWLASLLAVLGFSLIAAACDVLKDRTGFEGRPRENPQFQVLRNGESLALACVPLALAVLRTARIARACAWIFGLLGLGLLLTLGQALLTPASPENAQQIVATAIPGASLLVGIGDIQSARWLWCAGAALTAVPVVLALLRRRRGSGAAGDPGLGLLFFGLALTSAAMGPFFWHQADDAHRTYAYFSMPLIAFVAILLALCEGVIASARWARLALGGLGFHIAFWLLTGIEGGNFESGRQALLDEPLAALHFLLLALIPPILVAHLLLQEMLHGSGARRSRTRRSPGAQHLE